MSQSGDSQWEVPVYNIKAVARLTGVPADNLRRWESRHSIIEPQRTGSGYRLYSQRDVDTILWLKARLEEGLSISRAADMLRQQGGLPPRHEPPTPTAVQRPTPQAAPHSHSGVSSFEALRAELMAAFHSVNETEASAVLSDGLSLYSVEDVCMGVIQPALVEVGEAWLRGDISVAVEHFASSFVRARLANLFHSSPNNPQGPLVLVGCAPEEFHELGAMFLAVFLRRSGYRVVYLGQNVPLESLKGMIHALHPQAVCVSATRAETASSLYSLRGFLDELESRQGRAPLLAYGGQVFNRFPHISERLGGVYLGEDARQAVIKLAECLHST